MKCYCNSGKEFNQCCQPIITGHSKAETAEQLMRSRYSAFVIADISYLLNSHQKTTRPTKDRKKILKWTKSVRWIGLEIIATQKGSVSDMDGYVEFKAFFEENGKKEFIHENSCFIKENDIWYYKSGTHS